MPTYIWSGFITAAEARVSTMADRRLMRRLCRHGLAGEQPSVCIESLAWTKLSMCTDMYSSSIVCRD